MFPVLWKLMCAYLVIGVMGFCLIFFCLDRIGAKVDPDKTGRQVSLFFLERRGAKVDSEKNGRQVNFFWMESVLKLIL